MQAPVPMYMSFQMATEDVIQKITETLNEKFKEQGIKNVSFNIGIVEEFMDLEFIINEEDEGPMLEKLEQMGFDDSSYLNFDNALEMAFGTAYSYQLDYTQDAVIFASHVEHKHILTRIQDVFDSIDNMTADEAKLALVGLHKDFKTRYGWTEVKV